MFPTPPSPDHPLGAPAAKIVDRSVNNYGNNNGVMAGESVYVSSSATPPNRSAFDPLSFGVFINYRRGEPHSTAVALIRQVLVHRFGPRRVFLDISSVEPGSRYPDRLWIGLQTSHVVLAIIHPGWLVDLRRRGTQPGKDWVSFEIEAALKSGKVLIPVLLDGAPMLVEHDLPEEIRDLAHRTVCPLRSTGLARDLTALVEAVASHIA